MTSQAEDFQATLEQTIDYLNYNGPIRSTASVETITVKDPETSIHSPRRERSHD
ncbi:MAG: hypothetical protein ACFFFG_11925 [Candidatus Thorarchaeota archaeon]